MQDLEDRGAIRVLGRYDSHLSNRVQRQQSLSPLPRNSNSNSLNRRSESDGHAELLGSRIDGDSSSSNVNTRSNISRDSSFAGNPFDQSSDISDRDEHSCSKSCICNHICVYLFLTWYLAVFMANMDQIWELKTLYPELHLFIIADSAYQLMFIMISLPTFVCRSTQCFECYFKLRMAFFAVTVYLMEWGLQLTNEARKDWKMVKNMEEFKPLCEVIYIVT